MVGRLKGMRMGAAVTRGSLNRQAARVG
jgi:hypothetical protein